MRAGQILDFEKILFNIIVPVLASIGYIFLLFKLSENLSTYSEYITNIDEGKIKFYSILKNINFFQER